MSVIESRPWLALLRTDFVALLGSSACGASQPALESDQTNNERTSDDSAAEAREQEASEQEASDELGTRELVQRLPSEIMYNIFGQLDADGLSSAAQTCIQWRAYAYDPRFWRKLARKMWPMESPASLESRLWTPNPSKRNEQHLYRQPYLTWRRLVIYRPHLRTNGIYVQRHQYAKSRNVLVNGDGSVAPPIALVTYFRLMRFYSNGSVIALTSPEPPEQSYQRLRRDWLPSHAESNKAHPSVGNYALEESTGTVTIQLSTAQHKLYPDMLTGVQHITMSLCGTHPGAYNRLYLQNHFAVMDNFEIICYESQFARSAWRFVALSGFRTKVYEHFPKETIPDGRLARCTSQSSSEGFRDRSRP